MEKLFIVLVLIMVGCAIVNETEYSVAPEPIDTKEWKMALAMLQKTHHQWKYFIGEI